MSRRSAGERDQFTVRALKPLGDQIRANAQAAGMTNNDYLALIVAHALDMPDQAPVKPSTGQLTLPEAAEMRKTA
jgi:hypothetical protein